MEQIEDLQAKLEELKKENLKLEIKEQERKLKLKKAKRKKELENLDFEDVPEDEISDWIEAISEKDKRESEQMLRELEEDDSEDIDPRSKAVAAVIHQMTIENEKKEEEQRTSIVKVVFIISLFILFFIVVKCAW